MALGTTAWLRCVAVALALLCLHGPSVRAQEAAGTAVVYTQEELDQLLAPVALYPDALLAQVLTASTYPLEVVQAARFVQRNPTLSGDALARSVEAQGWEPSVSSLVQFPSVLAMMNDKLEWTQQLGDAFLSNQESVMDTVQSLRAKAQAAGTLQSTSQQQVVVQERYIVIEPVQPQVIYVPYYNPLVVYGTWWWPARPPWYWVPPPVYRPPTWGQVIATGVVWSVAIGITQSIWFDARPRWRERHVVIISTWPGRPAYRPGVWAHNPVHRHGVAYRDAPTRDRFVPISRPAVDKREPYRGRDDSVALRPAPRPEVRPAPVTRPAVRPAPAPRPETRPAVRPAPRPAAPVVRAAPAPRPSALTPGATRDVVRQQADRGRASRQAPTR